jgi:hypothetical protein
MLGSGLLDLGIALAVIFFLLSALASGLAELIEAVLKKRAAYLKLGLEQLLPKLTTESAGAKIDADFVARLYANPLITALYRGDSLPSYIPTRVFALALVSEIAKGLNASGPAALAVGPATVQGVLGAVPRNWKPGEAIAALAVEAKNDFESFLAGIGGWYDASMERVGGWYKRHTQALLLVLGVLLAGGLNADALSMARAVATDTALRQSLVGVGNSISTTAQPTDSAKRVPVNAEQLEALRTVGLPLGWMGTVGDPRHLPGTPAQWVLKLCGIFLTAVAISFGAPFWFDLLSRFVTVRSTVKPTPSDVSDQGLRQA